MKLISASENGRICHLKNADPSVFVRLIRCLLLADFVAEVAFGGLAHFGWAFRQRGLYLPRIAGG
jgi:hypothetical protein